MKTKNRSEENINSGVKIQDREELEGLTRKLADALPKLTGSARRITEEAIIANKKKLQEMKITQKNSGYFVEKPVL